MQCVSHYSYRDDEANSSAFTGRFTSNAREHDAYIYEHYNAEGELYACQVNCEKHVVPTNMLRVCCWCCYQLFQKFKSENTFAYDEDTDSLCLITPQLQQTRGRLYPVVIPSEVAFATHATPHRCVDQNGDRVAGNIRCRLEVGGVGVS
jgi:hypothetical protein